MFKEIQYTKHLKDMIILREIGVTKTARYKSGEPK